jgi:uncharacterized protein (TIGR02594 family)
MPEFQYRWTIAGAFLAFSTFVTSYIGIKGVEVVISKRRYWFVWACSAIVALGAWYLNAKQTADAAQDKRDLLAALNRSDPKPSVTLPNDAPAWVATAYKEIGQSEIPGVEENPRIAAYFNSLGYGKIYRDDKDDWSSPFVEWSLQQAGKFGPKSIKPADWLTWGKSLKVPTLGAIVVLNFSGLQHVGFYVGEDSDFVRILGGNQNDTVSVYRYPRSAVRGYRAP